MKRDFQLIKGTRSFSLNPQNPLDVQDDSRGEQGKRTPFN